MDRLHYSIEAEESVLGAIMLSSGTALPDVQDLVNVDDFYKPEHKLIFQAIVYIAEAGNGPDVLTVAELMEKREQNMPLAKLGELVQNTAGHSNARAYAKIVKDRAVRRQLLHYGDVVKGLSADGREIEDVLSEAQAGIMEIGVEAKEGGLQPLAESIGPWIDMLDSRAESEESIAGLSTGYTELDKKLNGLKGGNLIVIAGRPAMGKTALAMNIVNWFSNKHEGHTAVFSVEMPIEEIMTRMVSQIGSVRMDRLLSGDLDDEMWQRTNEATTKLINRRRILIDESPRLRMSQIRARARRAQAKVGKLNLIVVDYLQLLDGEKGDTRAQEISEMTRGLKALAKEMDVPIIVLSQLNRKVEERDNKRPRMSDLKESGGIEQDADVILLIYRDVVYNEHTRHAKIAEIIIAKQRNGPIGTVLLHYYGDYTQFSNVDVDEQREFWATKAEPKTRKRRGMDE